MQEMTFPGFKIFLGEYTPRHPPPIHAWYIGHTRGFQPLLSPSNILSHRKVPFQKMPSHGKILKKGPELSTVEDCVAQLAEHWASIPKVVGSIPTVARHIFPACPVWIHTQRQSNIM